MFNKKMFLSENISKKNSIIMTMYFIMNKKLDNLMDYVDIELNMNNLSKYIHTIAHEFPLLADNFRDYNAIYGYRTAYYRVDGQYKDFETLIEGVEDILYYLVDMDSALTEAKSLSAQEENEDYARFVNDQIKKLRKYKDIFLKLYDKINAYIESKNTMQDFDYRIEELL